MSAPFITRLDPPGKAIKEWDAGHRTAAQPRADRLPQTFLDAMSVREQVFIDEQKCSWENEVDQDDARSFHFVVYASISSTAPASSTSSNTTTTSDARKPSGHSLPVGTIRLVPPPHPPHPSPTEPACSTGNTRVATPKYHEPYLKLSRLAVLEPYRRLRLGKLLVNTALEFAQRHPAEARARMDPAAVEALRTHMKDVDAASASRDGPLQVDEIHPGVKDALPIDFDRNPVDGEEIKRVVNQATGEWKGLVLIHAQVSARSFWERLGFELDEGLGEWDEEGIMHVGMWKRVSVKASAS